MTHETTADNEWAAPTGHRMSRRTDGESAIAAIAAIFVVRVRRCAS